MAWRTACILALIWLSVLPSWGDSSSGSDLTASEYGARLDALIEATGKASLTGPQVTDLIRDLPQAWHVHIDQQTFDLSTGWLRQDLLSYSEHANQELLQADHQKLLNLRSDLDAYLKAAPDNSTNRSHLAKILSRREFGDVHGPTWLDQLKQRILLSILRFLGRTFRSSAIPTIGKLFVYVLVALAVLGLGIWFYRTIRADAATERLIPEAMVVSAKEWTVWMAEAREAANQGQWRDAIHLAYWAGISFLEAQGTWRPDRARTPREYLRLMPQSSEKHPTLSALTRSFEVVWYGNREADSQAFSQTLQELEKLGCRPN